MAKKNKMKRLTDRSILRDKFVPVALSAINVAPVAARWVVCHEGGPDGADDSSPIDMDRVIAGMAQNFIPRVQCTCSGDRRGFTEPIHCPSHYLPFPVHRIPPDFSFALRDKSDRPIWNRNFDHADLDETTSIDEYASTFRGALRLEHEEKMDMYEKYTLFRHGLHQVGENKASLHVDGISDARPALKISDIVLLRPVQPLFTLASDTWSGVVRAQQYMIEVESRILHIIRGKGGRPDQVIISWDLSLEQRDALKDHIWVRQYAVRFIPNPLHTERCLTALDWLEDSSLASQKTSSTGSGLKVETMKGILFPVEAPIVKPLTAEQRQVHRGVPTAAHYSSQMDVNDIGKPLNELQQSFVRMVRARTLDPSYTTTRPPMILTGPAGTGKTKTLIYAIADVLGLLQNGKQNNGQSRKDSTNRVMVCCPSHAASDVLTRRLSGLMKRTEIFRLYDATRPANTVPGYILPFTCQVPESDRFTLPPPGVWTGLKVVICTCMDAHLLFRAQVTNESIRAKQLCFQTYLTSESNPLGLTLGQVTVNDDPFFTHLFIDEAAQATEPEILCPMSCVVDPNPGGRKVEIALIGDPRQLSPRVFAKNVSDNLGRSFMERLLRRPVTCMGGGEESLLGPSTHPNSLLDTNSSLNDLIRYYASVDGQEQLTVFLTENYRGHPSFLMMPSSFFYYDRLRSSKMIDADSLASWCNRLRVVEDLSGRMGVAMETMENLDNSERSSSPLIDMFCQIKRQTTWPIHFRGVKGLDSSIAIENFSGTDSWQNLMEATATVEIISALVKNGVDPSRIGAMSPFRGQVVAIRKLLRAKHFHDVNVGTIENYQAVEQDVIVLSLTRSSSAFVAHDRENRMGIFGQPKQMNVAMTRAENLFIVVGNPDVMWEDPCWRQWLKFCCRNGLWYGEGLNVCKRSMKDANFISTIDLTNTTNFQKNAVLVSTIEKIHRNMRVLTPTSSFGLQPEKLDA